ncbi:hypothetical protein FACS189425_11020 [Clostridia bacterium]|nr:hypothetical protein FACS189425_11020 [Clostridia bacterium]
MVANGNFETYNTLRGVNECRSVVIVARHAEGYMTPPYQLTGI